jgi:hypothetical protein
VPVGASFGRPESWAPLLSYVWVQGLGFRDRELGVMSQDIGFRIRVLGFRV